MKTIDARGMSCPEPLLMLANALKTETDVLLTVDNKTALDNCAGYAGQRGYGVEITNGDGEYSLRITARAK